LQAKSGSNEYAGVLLDITRSLSMQRPSMLLEYNKSNDQKQLVSETMQRVLNGISGHAQSQGLSASPQHNMAALLKQNPFVSK
jgi:hypothetical protein